MSIATSQVQIEELSLMDDATSFWNTIGPMALPIIFIVWPLVCALIVGAFLNWWYVYNPPLIGGWSVGWLSIPFWAFVEGRYVFKHFQIATKSSWLTWRYWMGKRHLENDFKVDHWQPLGRAVKKQTLPTVRMADTPEGRQPAQNGTVHPDPNKKEEPKAPEPTEPTKPNFLDLTEGLETGKYGYISKPHLFVKREGVNCSKIHTRSTSLQRVLPSNVCANRNHYVDIAGDLIYEIHFKSKRFPVALVCLPDTPETLISYDGNVGVVVQGGLMFEVEHIGAVSFVRCDHTKTAEIPYIPIGVLTDYSQLAQDVHDQIAITYVPKEAVAVAAQARDTFYADDYFRKWKDTEMLLQKTQDQEQDIDKKIDERVAALATNASKVRSGVKQPLQGTGTRGKRPWLPWVVVVVAIVVTVVLARLL